MNALIAILAILFIMFLYTRSDRLFSERSSDKKEFYKDGNQKVRGIDTE